MSQFSIRRSLPSDITAIMALVSDSVPLLKKSFPNFSNVSQIEEYIATSYLSLTCELQNEDQLEICGFVVFENGSDQLKERSFHEQFLPLQSNYKFSITNSIFMTFMHIEPLYLREVLPQVYSTVFTSYSLLDYILFIGKKGSSFPWIQQVSFTKITFENAQENSELLKLDIYAADRKHYVPKLRIRQARVEDNDDLTPLLSLKDLTNLPREGDFWLSEQLHNQNEERQILVAENTQNGQIVGVIYVVKSDRDGSDIMMQYELMELDGLFTVSQFEDLDREDDTSFRMQSFEIKMFFILPEFEDRSIDFIHASFQAFPNLNYGSIFLSFQESERSILEPFVITTPKLDVEVHEALHIISRSSFYDQLYVSTISSSEAPQEELFTNLLQLVPNDPEFHSNLNESLRNPNSSLRTIILKNQEEKVIGVAIAKDSFDQLHQFANTYNLEDFVNLKKYYSKEFSTNAGEIYHIYIDTLYSKHSNAFIRQILTECNISLLLYIPSNDPCRILNKELICLTERRHIESPSQVLLPLSRHPTFFITKTLLNEPKTEVHSRIVVIGASKTGLSFIKTLLMIPYIYFTSITLVSPDGIQDVSRDLQGNPDVFDSELFFGEDSTDFNNLQLRVLLNRPNITVVKDKLEEISRNTKIISCVGNQLIPFEVLILTASRLYKLPASLTELESFPQDGIYDLRNESSFYDDLKEYVEQVVMSPGNLGNIILYGNGYNVLYTAHALTKNFNIPTNRLTFVCPEGFSNLFNGDTYLEEKVSGQLSQLSVKVYSYFSVDNFDTDESGHLRRVIISNTPEIQLNRQYSSGEAKNLEKKLYEISCSLMINCQEMNVDKNLLVTFNHESLVFDGRLIVDPQFRTTDPSIYSAGSLAKFSRRFGVSQKMELSNAHELGEKMAFCTLNSSLGIDEFYQEHIAPHLTLIQTIPKFESNVTKCGLFVGGYRFFRSHVREYDPSECEVLYTDNNDRYIRFSIHRVSGIIQEITLYSKEILEENNIAFLVGLPSSYLSNMTIRFYEGLIKDFIQFLREDWALAIYCDDFKKYRKHTFEQITSLTPEVESFAKKVIEEVRNGEKYSWTEAEYELADSLPERFKDAVEQDLIQILDKMQNFDGHFGREVYYIPKVNDI